MKIIIVFRTGFQLPITCEEFTLERDVLGNPIGYDIKNITDNKPIHFDFKDVLCVYRVVRGEEE
jgi:hypothetical protein